MNRFFTITLIGIHLFANTEVGQIFKFPQLISHYFQHSRINPDINFLEFLAMHYDGDDGTTADDNEDKKLPYHNINSFSFSYIAVLKTLSFPEDFKLEEKSIFGDRSLTSNSSEHVLLILQPPRQA